MTYLFSDQGVLPQNAVRIAEVIKDYDDSLELRWIPSSQRTVFDNKPYAVWQCLEGTEPYIVMALSVDELDHRVLQTLFMANRNNGNVLDRIEAHDAAVKAMQLREKMDQQEEEKEFAKWAVSSNKRVKHNGRVYE